MFINIFSKKSIKIQGRHHRIFSQNLYGGRNLPPKLRYKSNKTCRFHQILVAFPKYINCNLVSLYKNGPNMAWVWYFRVLFLHLGCVKSIFSRLYGRFTIRNASWTCLFMFLFCTFHIRATGI